MSVQILANSEQGAVFYSSSTEWAFGPVMPDEDIAEAFLRTFSRVEDPRLLDDTVLERRWADFQQKLACPMGHTKANILNHANGETHFSCMAKGCKEVWDLHGNVVTEEDEEDDDIEF